MLFLETWFWLFAAVVVPLYWLCPRALKAYWLFAASAVFQYHFAGPAGMAPIVVLGVLTYAVGIAISQPARGWLFHPSWMVVVGALAFFKYQGFLVGNGVAALTMAHVPVPAWLTNCKQPAIPL